MNNIHEEKTLQPYTIRFSESEVAAVRYITKVNAVAPAVRSIVLRVIEQTAIKENGGYPVSIHDRFEG